MKKLFILIPLILCLGAGTGEEVKPEDSPKFTDDEVFTIDPGLSGIQLWGAAEDKKKCRDGCAKRNPGGCMLIHAEANREVDTQGGTRLHCHCVWLCMPALKNFA